MEQDEDQRPPTPGLGCGGTMAVTVLAVIGGLLVVWILFPLRGNHCDANGSACMNNQRQIIFSILTYTQDHDNKLPLPDRWIYVARVAKPVWDCPVTKRVATQTAPDYGCNSLLLLHAHGTVSRLPLTCIAHPFQVLATADADVPLLASLDDIAYRHKDNHAAVASFLDGHIERLRLPGVQERSYPLQLAPEITELLPDPPKAP